MKHLLLLAFALPLVCQAQNAPVDFEAAGYGADFTWTVFENLGNPALEIVANPAPDAVNASSTVAAFTALNGGAPWAGCETLHGSDIGTFSLTPTTSSITIMVYKSVLSDVGIKLVEASSASLGEIKIANTLVNQWEAITFDFSSMEGISYDQIVIFPDFQERTTDNLCYFDNITFGEQVALPSPMTAAPDPTIDASLVISMFSGVYTNEPVDTWLAEWSIASQNEVEIEGNATQLYGGLSFAGIETIANQLDLTEMTMVHFDMWSANATELRFKLVDFGADATFDGGDDSEHEITIAAPEQGAWVNVSLPLSDFTGLNASSNMAQYIFSANPNGTAVVYIDNLFFSKPMPDSVDDLQATFPSVYPNPTSSSVRLEGTQGWNSLRVLDLTGAEVQTLNAPLPQQLDLSHLPVGTYLIVFEGAAGTFTQRVMVK